ncbi:MAG TPA: glycoside hydrolase family 31 protein [Candidatus Gemmiger avicola]|uniref:Glycoside hydrolase family 31 protein n=1 Tax=Candidatus Gemmiger avicola TaxID=2838605 RepID=A0A9D2M7H6_9FIRM|nr:glycoside hydrolase family 31 protein [Candidatus Gemmiger avicola]
MPHTPYFEQQGSALLYRNDGETVRVEPWGPDSLRVRAGLLDDLEHGSIALLAPSPADADDIAVSIMENCATLRHGKITVEMRLQDWGHALQLRFYNARGELLLQEIPNGYALSLRARHYKPLPGGNFRLRASFVSDPDEKIYGMGQYQQERINWKGCNLELAHRNSQVSIPFYLSSKGYGFLWHNAAVGEVHFGLNTTQWEAESTRQLDYWITAGDTPKEIERRYTEMTGRAPMMPEYGLGFWQCKLRYYNQQQVLDVAQEYKRRGIPLDVLIIDYYHWPRCGDYRFDPEYFPAPAEMIRELDEMGIATMVSVWPQIDWRSENYAEMKQLGLLVKANTGVDVQMVFHGNNVFFDATNPRARAYVWDKIRQNYAALGVRAFWLDEAEPEFTTYDYDNYRYYAGPVTEIGNIYPREYAKMFYEGQQREGRTDIVSLTRCAWVGSQRYGALVWSGDIFSTWEDFRKQVCAGLHMGLAGIPWWTTDIGGFHGGCVDDPAFQELLVRWFQFGAFCPVMRIHGNRAPHQPIVNQAGEEREQTGAGNEVWSFGPQNEEILVRYIRLRETMRPYLRAVMQDAHSEGNPVLRTLFYEFPQDAAAWDCQDEYCFGPDLLVAPVLEPGAQSRPVYLPAGASWTELHTGAVYAGGQTVAAAAPLATIPVFLRDGRHTDWIGLI